MSGGPQYLQGVMNSTLPPNQQPTQQQAQQQTPPNGSPSSFLQNGPPVTSQIVPTTGAPQPFPSAQAAASSALQTDLEVSDLI